MAHDPTADERARMVDDDIDNVVELNDLSDAEEEKQQREHDEDLFDVMNDEEIDEDHKPAYQPTSRYDAVRHFIWEFMDNPASSRPAFWWSLFIMFLIGCSVIAFIWETMPEYHEDPPIAFFIIETIVVIIFTIELVVRFATCPRKLHFFKVPLNWVDFLAIAPYYVELVFSGLPGLAWIRVIRLTRVFRIMKLGRYQAGFLLFYYTFTRSAQTLVMGLVFISLGIILFSSFMFYAEQSGEEFDKDLEEWVYEEDISYSPGVGPSGCCGAPFQSIPHTFWWCLVTMTTVGYGDNYPITPLGKTVAGFTFLSGLLIIAFPVAILGNTFLELYLQQEEEVKAVRAKKNEARYRLHPEERLAHLVPPVRTIAQHLSQTEELLEKIEETLEEMKGCKLSVETALVLFDHKRNPAMQDIE